MKRNVVKRVLALAMMTMLAIGTLAGCGGSGSDSAQNDGGSDATVSDSAQNDGGDDAAVSDSAQSDGGDEAAASNEDNGKILMLSTLTSGAQYDFHMAFYEKWCEELGYDFELVLADTFNDPDGNLSAVRNAYTSDVVGLIATVDGGLSAIMKEYPDMWVVGYYTDLDAVFDDDGTSHDVMENEKFLGCMGDNYISGEELGKAYAEEVIKRGYKKVSTIIFPVYAYPKHTVADATFRAEIEAYNATASEKIEVVGDAEVLEFKPLDAAYFLEDGHSDLDAIVGFCAGTTFIYPPLATAKADGSCQATTQLVTGGFDANDDILADSGDDKTIVSICIEAPESALYPIVMLDNAIQGKMYSDYDGTPKRYTSGILMINSSEAFAAIKDNSPLWEADLSKMQLSYDDMKQYFTRYNENASYEDMIKAITTDLSVSGYMN